MPDPTLVGSGTLLIPQVCASLKLSWPVIVILCYIFRMSISSTKTRKCEHTY